LGRSVGTGIGAAGFSDGFAGMGELSAFGKVSAAAGKVAGLS
jgi:hypothetical protein